MSHEPQVVIRKEDHRLMAGRLARVAELVDARDLKSLGRKAVPVRFRSRAPEKKVGFYEPAFFI